MRKLLSLLLAVILGTAITCLTTVVEAATPATIGVQYQAQVQKIGWQEIKSNGQVSGTMGSSLRLEALKIKLINAPAAANIKYQTHVQGIGWQTYVSNGQLSGTQGKSLRVEAVKLALENLPGYSIQYRAYVQRTGWMDWVSDGNITGITGKSLRVEAIEIKLVKTADSSTPTPIPFIAQQKPTYIVNSLNTGNSSQVVVVYTDGYKNVTGTCETFSLINGNWTRAFNPFCINLGYNGFALVNGKIEGDGKSPQGKYSFGSMMFGKYANPGVHFTYRKVDSNDFWVDDSSSSLYNQYVRGPNNGRWKSAESLLRSDNLYSYAAVINYNASRTPGKGSAIFFHQWSSLGSGTSGCIATPQGNLLNVLGWLDKSKNPIIIMGVKSNLKGF